MDTKEIRKFLRPLINPYGNGNGYGSGYGSGNGNGNGYGSGNGNGNGNGYGSGSGNGYGDGYGSGSGYGYGDGYGDGNGNGSGSGNGDGYGDGNGYGSGNGNGNGYGSGNGDGYGNGDGNGYGDGYGIKRYNKKPIVVIDSLQTIIESVKGDIAKGFILNTDLSLSSCYIVRNDYFYSHGKTLKEAVQSLTNKTSLSLPVEKRIENFKAFFKDYNKKYKASKFYDWHFKLTGSCKMGRDNFCKSRNINLKGTYSVNEFIDLTKNEYRGDIIKLL